MEFYTVEKIGRRRAFTPDGFLLCYDVPIARTGTQIYSASEVPTVEAGKDGLIVMERAEDEVFREETIASVNGKPVTIDHPNDMVSPQTWKFHAVGVALNARRGTGADADLLLADLIITDEDAIKQIEETDGQQISAGYGYKEIQIAPGKGRQTDIVINHIALVDNARCGIRCSIRDADSIGEKMKLTLKELGTKLRDAFQKKDCAAFDSAVKALDGEGSEIHLHEAQRSAYDDNTLKGLFEKNESEHSEHAKRLDAIDSMLKDHAAKFEAMDDDDEGEEAEEEERKKKEKEAKEAADAEEKEMREEMADEVEPGKEEEAKTAKDSAILSDAWRDVASKAEIIAPGISLPAFDKASHPVNTFKAICDLRRKALVQAMRASDTAALIAKVNRRAMDSAFLGKMTCGQVKTTFDSVAEMKRLANNTATTGGKADLAKVRELQGQSGNGISSEDFMKLRAEKRKEMK